MIDPYYFSYLLIGVAVFVFGKKLRERAGEDEPVMGFIGCLLLWPILVLYPLTDYLQKRKRRRK